MVWFNVAVKIVERKFAFYGLTDGLYEAIFSEEKAQRK